jgi:hypothetical protein
MTKPPTSPTRLSVPLTPEVHAAFQRMADATGMSLGRCISEWLQDTLEGVTLITHQLEKARQAPRQVVAEMRQGLLGMLDESDQLLADLRSGKKQPPGAGGVGVSPARAASAAAPPRPVIRGGKSPNNTTNRPVRKTK